MEQQTDATDIPQMVSAEPTHADYLTCPNDNNHNNNNNDNHNKHNNLFLNPYNDELFNPIPQRDIISAFSRIQTIKMNGIPMYMRDLTSTHIHAPAQGPPLVTPCSVMI